MNCQTREHSFEPFSDHSCGSQWKGSGVSEKEAGQQGEDESANGDDGFHDGPWAEGILFVHAEVFAHEPEAAVVDMGEDGGSGGNSDDN